MHLGTLGQKHIYGGPNILGKAGGIWEMEMPCSRAPHCPQAGETCLVHLHFTGEKERGMMNYLESLLLLSIPHLSSSNIAY